MKNEPITCLIYSDMDGWTHSKKNAVVIETINDLVRTVNKLQVIVDTHISPAVERNTLEDYYITPVDDGRVSTRLGSINKRWRALPNTTDGLYYYIDEAGILMHKDDIGSSIDNWHYESGNYHINTAEAEAYKRSIVYWANHR